ncbi:MAG: transcriptional regulator [Alphaproteobacteria bacterium]|nr:MAG: transcriptional regulator [Alphaproteobacteria bacterium]
MTSHALEIRRDITEGIESEFVGHGLAFGKFMPPTNGHLYFLNFARQSCRKLTILVCSLPSEPIPGEVRYKWIKELFPDCNVVHHYIDIPQEPNGPDDLAFFETWRDSIHKHCPGEKFDALFASEDYGYKVARIMDIRFVPVNVKRDLVEISGTAMRNNPLQHWEHLHPVVRPYFLKRVAIVGPESTGKSMLARNLAEHFDTAQVAEYARAMLENFAANIPGVDMAKPEPRDFSTIARGQIASEDAIARQANRILFCDTELLTTSYWSKHFFGACPHWIERLAEQRSYDLYMLLDPRGVENLYASDPLRLMPELKDRIAMFDWWREELTRRKLPFAVIDGDTWAARFQKAVVSVYQNIPAMIGAAASDPPLRVVGQG